MAANIEFKATSDDADLKRSLARAQSDVAKLKAQVVDLGAKSRVSAQEFKSGFAGGVAQLGKMAAGLISVQTAVNLVRGAYTEWRTVMDQVAEKHRNFSAQFMRTLTHAGLLGMGPEFERLVTQIPGASREQAAAALAGVTEAAPELLSQPERIKALTRAAGGAAPLFPKPEDMKVFASTVAELGTIFEKEAPQAVADMALAAQQAVGAGAAEIISQPPFQRAMDALVAAGATPKQALKFALATEQAEQQPKFLTTLAGRALKEGIDTQAEFQALLKKPERVLEGKELISLRQILEKLPGVEAEFARRPGVAAQIAQLPTFAAGRELLEQQRLARLEDEQRRAIEAQAAARARVLEESRIRTMDLPAIEGFFERLGTRLEVFRDDVVAAAGDLGKTFRELERRSNPHAQTEPARQ